MRFIVLTCLLLMLPAIAAAETLKMTAPQEGKGLGNLQPRKSNAAPATIEELFTPKPAAKKPPPDAKPDVNAILRDIDAKLDSLQQQVSKLDGLEGVSDEKLLAAIDRLNTLASTLASMQKKAAEPDGGGATDSEE